MKKGLLIVLAFILLVAVVVSSASVFQKANASSALSIVISDGYLRGIPVDTNFRSFKNSFDNSNNWNWHIYPKDATKKYDYLTESDASPIYTGCTFRVELSFDNTVSYDIVVAGDVNGDGYANQADYMAIKLCITQFGGTSLTGCYFKAADLNSDGNITPTDYLRLKRYLRGTYTINNTFESDYVPTQPSESNSEDPWYTGWY